MHILDTSWAEYHTAGVSVLTSTPVAETDGGNVGAVLVVAFLVAITVVALGRVLAPVAQLAQTLIGATGAVLLTVAAFVLVVFLAVT
jgi:hypothetical protein